MGVGAQARASEAPTMAPAPGWVVADAVADTVQGAGGLRYELVSDQVDLTGRRPQWYRRISYTVQREKSLDDAGQIAIDYQPQYQQLVLNSLEVWRDGKRLDLSRTAHYARLRRESGLEDGLIDGAATLSITLPDLRVGDRVDYGVTITGSNPVFGQGYYDVFDARYGVPLGERRVRVRYPATLPLRWRVGAPGFSKRVQREGEVTVLDISAKALPGVHSEDDTPRGVDPYGVIELSTASSWRQVANWAVGLYPRTFSDRKVADRIAETLQLRSGDPEQALLRAVAFVQGEIRYVGLDMGENSHAPHAPEVTLRNRYGDCKDKATLLIALLDLAGIRAEPVLVDSDDGQSLDMRVPSPMAFDHVVVRAHLPQGEVWVDATRDREQGALAQRVPLSFKRGLPVLPDQPGLVEVPAPMPLEPQIEVNEEVSISLRKLQRVATFSVVTDYRQGRGERIASSFEDDGAEAVGEHYLKYMQQYYTALTQVRAPTLDDSDPLRLRTEEHYRLEWPKSEGDEVGFPLFQLSDWMDELPTAPRRLPLALGGPRLARQTVRVQTDPQVWVAPQRTVVANPWFRFSRTIGMQDGRVVIVGEWQRLSDRIPPEELKKAAADMERARDLIYFNQDVSAVAQPRAPQMSGQAFVPLLTGLGALVALVLSCLAWGRFGGLGAMLFDPYGLAARMPQQVWLGRSAWAVAMLEAGLSSWTLLHPRPWWLVALCAVVLLGLSVAFSALLPRVLRWMGAVVPTPPLSVLLGAQLPGLICALAALVALGWEVELLGRPASNATELVRLAMYLLLTLLGTLWWAVCAVQALAGATGCGRARALGAVALGVTALAILTVLVGVPLGLLWMQFGGTG
nr:DUF3857 domain-containing protein [Xanthomonas maliensis]